MFSQYAAPAGRPFARTPMKYFYPCLNTRTPPGLLHQLTALQMTAWSWSASRCQLAQVHRTCDSKTVGGSGGSAVQSSTRASISSWPGSSRCFGLWPSHPLGGLHCHLPAHLNPLYWRPSMPSRPLPGRLSPDLPTFTSPCVSQQPLLPSLCGHLVPDLVIRLLLLARLGH